MCSYSAWRSLRQGPTKAKKKQKIGKGHKRVCTELSLYVHGEPFFLSLPLRVWMRMVRGKVAGRC